MLEILIGPLLEFLGEVVFQIAIEALIELGFEAFVVPRRRRQRNPALVIFGLLVFGALVGLVSVWILPRRIFPAPAHLSGISIVLAPLATGAAMRAFGARRRRRGRATSGLATFWGGAAFAFAMALARWLAVAR